MLVCFRLELFPEVEQLWDRHAFCFLRDFCIVLLNSCINLHSHWEYIRVPLFTHLCLHFMFWYNNNSSERLMSFHCSIKLRFSDGLCSAVVKKFLGPV